MSGSQKPVMPADPNQALAAYLEGLLAPVQAEPAALPPRLDERNEVAAVIRPSPVADRSGAVIARPRTTNLNEPVLRLPNAHPVVEPSLKGRELVPVKPAPRRAGPPEWADEPFPCLLFRASGLTLAVPLIHLNGVLPWPDEITPMPGHQDWFLGLVRNQQSSVKVIDTAAVVVPPDRPRAAPQERESAYRNVVLIDEGRWGLACDAVEQMITLDPGGVRWRTAAGKRPWLAGTVIEQMCALLDVSAFAEMLTTGER